MVVLYEPTEPQEISLYQELYGRCVDINNPQVLNPIKLIDLIGRSCLDKAVLKSIWDVGTQSKRVLDKYDLYACLRCVALAQAGLPVTLEALKGSSGKQGMYPKFSTWAIPAGVKQQNYEPLFEKQKLTQGKLAENDAKEFFKMSKLSDDKLLHVFRLCDVDKDRSLSKAEFCVAMHMILLIKQKKMNLPREMPVELSHELHQTNVNINVVAPSGGVFSQPSTPRSVSSSSSRSLQAPAAVGAPVPPAVGAPAQQQQATTQDNRSVAGSVTGDDDARVQSLTQHNQSVSDIMNTTNSLNNSIREVHVGASSNVSRLVTEKARLEQELDFLNAERESQMRVLAEATEAFRIEQATVVALNEKVQALRLSVASLREQSITARMNNVALREEKASLKIEEAQLAAEKASLEQENMAGAMEQAASAAAESIPELSSETPPLDAPRRAAPTNHPPDEERPRASPRPEAPGHAVAAAPSPESPAIQQEDTPPPTRQAPEATPPVVEQQPPPSPTRAAPSALPKAAETSEAFGDDPFNTPMGGGDEGPILQNDPFSADLNDFNNAGFESNFDFDETQKP